MEYIRLIHVKHYDVTRREFKTGAFQRSAKKRGGGLSIIQCDCISATGKPICEHVRIYYPSAASEPPIYWKFDESVFPSGYRIEQSDSDTGDICHHNVFDVSHGSLEKIFRSIPLSEFLMCRDGMATPITANDHERLAALADN